MLKRTTVRLFLLTSVLTAWMAAPAHAQFTPRSLNDPATGETYHVEVGAGLWSPSADMSISSEARFGIVGTTIDLRKDLGLTDHTFKELQVVLRATRRNKFRFQYIPIKFEQTAALPRDIVFQGIRYQANIPVNSVLDWKAFRFAYEFDIVSKNRGFAGLVLDAKYTDVYAELRSPVNDEWFHPRAPIPAIGGIGRYYIVPNISITGELTGIKVPNVSDDYKGHYVDFDMYGTVNFTNNIGAQLGYRSFDVGYVFKKDQGAFTLKGLYFGAVARF
jgi:hypothetical protein